MHGEAVVSSSHLALRSGERVLLTGCWMKKHGEVVADLFEACIQQVIGFGADDDPVNFIKSVAQQLIANGTTDSEYVDISLKG